MDNLREQIDGIKAKISDKEYLDLMNSLQAVYALKVPCWEAISDTLLDDDPGFGQHLSMSMIIALESRPHDMVSILARALDNEQRACAKLQSVVAYMATIAHDTIQRCGTWSAIISSDCIYTCLLSTKQ